MRTGAMVVLAVALSACTSVKMVQRDGCWVRQTEKMFGQVNEQLGLCARETPKWSDDRLTRLVQECMAQADYRWQNRALEAWGRGDPLPPQADEEQVLETCLNETATSAVAENEGLKARLGELTADRSALTDSLEAQLAHLRNNHEEMTVALGEAAKRPTPSAVATATSNGTATTQSDSMMQPPAGSAPVALMPGCGPGRAPTSPVAQNRMTNEGVGGSGQPDSKPTRIAEKTSSTRTRAENSKGAEATRVRASSKADRATPRPECEPIPEKKASGSSMETGLELTKVTSPAKPTRDEAPATPATPKAPTPATK